MRNPDILKTETIPAELKARRRWVLYRLEPESIKKHPLDADLERMEWENPANWLTYDAALTAHRGNSKADGIGCFLGAGIWGIDVDHCVNPDGSLDDQAAAIVALMDSYTEYSPSGTGLHILFRSTDTQGDRPRKRVKAGLEIYDGESSPRYFTMTGNVLPGHDAIRERDAAKETFFSDYMGWSPQKQNARGSSFTAVESESGAPDDDELIEWMLDRVPAAARLWRGDMNDYNGDHSSADQALANTLVSYAHGDTARAERLFYRSELGKRDKWIKRADYRAMTLDKAATAYNPALAPSYASFELWKLDHDPALTQAVESFRAAHKPAESPTAALSDQGGIDTPENEENATDGATEAYTSLADGFMISSWAEAVEDFRANSHTKTGWSNLDKQIFSLYPGLYVLGAQPAAGKTTWAWQLAEQLAVSGRKAIYVTLEQTRFELVSKSIARRAFLLSGDLKSPSAVAIRRGVKTEYTRRALDDFTREAAGNLYVYEGGFNTKIETLTGYLQTMVERLTTYEDDGRPIRPAVFLDYLQPLGTVDERKDSQDTTRTKRVIECIKSFQRAYNLIMVVITAYSRDAYKGQSDVSSARDTSGIEYTADVVMGLDLAVYHEPLPDDSKERKRMINQAKKAYPREIMLNITKSRYYPPIKNAFRYHSRQDCFTEYDYTATDEDIRLWEKELVSTGGDPTDKPLIL